MTSRIIGTLLLLTLSWFASANQYTETGECQEAGQVCSYTYNAQQDFFDDQEMQTMSVNASVDITCSSSGMYNGSNAKLLCMTVKDASLVTNLLENSTDEEIEALQQTLNNQLASWFCFVQTTNGKIPAVFHRSSEPPHIVSLKKAIAAAFQANFDGTEEEEETDPQSKHKSHYIYTPAEEGVIKMKRSVRKSDVSEYSNEAPLDDVDTSKDEEVEYQAGKLRRSSGRTAFHLANETRGNNSDLNSTISLTQAFSASGFYSLDLESCSQVSRHAYNLQKNKIMSEVENAEEEDLKATVDKKKEGIEQMKILRGKLPSGSALIALRNYESYGEKLVSILQILMELESEHGALHLYIPVLDDIMTFITEMQMTPYSKEVREAVMMMLTEEGSLRSQMALLSIYDNAIDNTEANTVLIHISYIKRVRIGFVIAMEERLNREIDDSMLAGQLLLVFGSLATKGSSEVEERVMNYLTARVAALEVGLDVSEIVLLLHALGNTGSKLCIAPIFSILDLSADNTDYEKVKLSAVDSLLKITDDPVVLTRLDELVNEDPTADFLAAILETLDNALEYVRKNGDIEQYISLVKNHPLLSSLVENIASSNDSTIHEMMEKYLIDIQAEMVHFEVLYSQRGSPDRAKRGTDWDQSYGDYDLVRSYSERVSDVNTYSRHTAYINSRRIGIDEANVKIAYGYFAGTTTHCDSMKVFGRTRVVATLLSHSATYADVKVDVGATSTSTSIMAYARIGSNTLLNYNTQRSLSTHCFAFSRNLATYRTRIFRLSFSLWIYVATITLGVDVNVHFNMAVNAKVCIGRHGLENTGGLATLTPTLGVTVTGSVSAGLLYLVRGGIDAEVTLNYRLEPAVNVEACTAYCTFHKKLRLGLFDSFPDNNIRLYAWWQHQTIDFCGSGWFTYPCIRWGRKHTWDSLTRTWNLGSQARRAVWQHCTGSLHPQCTDGDLNSSFFTC